jgi:uncharacterized protein involved in exopolysaccharide biosynthesis
MTAPDLPARNEQSLRDLAKRVARRRWLLLGTALGVFAAVAIWTFTATPRYRSEARVRIESQSQSPTSAISDQVSTSIPAAGGLLGFGRDELETEVGVLRSDRVADAMIDSLALGVRMTTPVGNRATVLDARVVGPDATTGQPICRQSSFPARLSRLAARPSHSRQSWSARGPARSC